MIGYYIHHHGRGHLHRAESLARALPAPVTALSSVPRPASEAFADWVELARDDAGHCASDPSAHGRLHWVPYGDDGLRERMAAIAEWVQRNRPRAVVVDVSVEVTTLIRLMGVPVVVVAQAGERFDEAHRLVYDLAERIIAPWPREIYDPVWLTPHAAKTSYVGAWSRFDGRAGEPSAPADSRPRVLVLTGAGGSSVSESDVRRCAAAHPRFAWSSVGLPGGEWIDDPWPQLCSADVVISHAGQNAIAEVAAAGRPAVVIAQARPFSEQVEVARALGAAGIVVTRSDWHAAAADWDAVLGRAIALGGSGWQRWVRADANRAAADAILLTAGLAGPSSVRTPQLQAGPCG